MFEIMKGLVVLGQMLGLTFFFGKLFLKKKKNIEWVAIFIAIMFTIQFVFFRHTIGSLFCAVVWIINANLENEKEKN